MRNQLDSKTGLIKSINAKDSDGMGLGLGIGKLVVQPLFFVGCLRCLPQIQGFAASTLRTEICPACDSFQRPLAASPGSWLLLKKAGSCC